MPSKYQPLGDYLAAQADARVVLTFTHVEALLARGGRVGWRLLPASAYGRAWWMRSSTTQGRAWRDAGWQVAHVDLRQQRVTFVRTADAGSTT